MNSHRPTILIIFAIAILVIFCLVFTGTLFTTSYVSMTEAMVEIMDDTDAAVLNNEDPEEQPEENHINVNSVDGIDIDLYYKLLSLNWDKIPNDIRLEGLDWNSNPFSGKNGKWTVKSYLYAYMLAMEICLREEINPPDTKVIIKPEHLLGKWLSEDPGTCIPNDTYLMWDKNQRATTEGFLYSAECVGALGMSNRWQNVEQYSTNPIKVVEQHVEPNWVSIDQAELPIGCLYISRLENPSLADEKRAVIGKSNAFRDKSVTGDSALRYVTRKILNKKSEGYKGMPKCDYAELSGSLKEGTLPTEILRKIKDRPNVAFLPDAMYSTALSVRLGIEGKSMDHLLTGGCYPVYLSNIQDYVAQINDKNQQVIQEICIAASFQQFAGGAFCSGFESRTSVNNKSSSGIYYMANMALIEKNISPVVIRDLMDAKSVQDAVNMLMNGAGNVARLVLIGDFQNTFDIVKNEEDFLKDLEGETIKNALWKKCYNAFSDEAEKEYFLAALYQGYSTKTHKLYPSGYAGKNMREYQGYMTTGYSVLNASAVTEKICPEMVDYVFSLDDYTNAEKYLSLCKNNSSQSGEVLELSDAITGLSCLGDNCICHEPTYHDSVHKVSRTIPYTQKDPNDECNLALTDHYFWRNNITIQEAIETLEGAKINKITATEGNPHNAGGYCHKISNVVKPVRAENNKLLSLMYSTYPGHRGVDIISPAGIAGQRVTPIADGIIVGIGYYPIWMTNFKYINGKFTPASVFEPNTNQTYGTFVVVLHLDQEGKPWSSLYAHFSRLGHIQVGCLVTPETVLGYVGSTGKSTGAHLHVEIRPYDSSFTSRYSNGNASRFTNNDYIARALEGRTNYATY